MHISELQSIGNKAFVMFLEMSVFGFEAAINVLTLISNWPRYDSDRLFDQPWILILVLTTKTKKIWEKDLQILLNYIFVLKPKKWKNPIATIRLWLSFDVARKIHILKTLINLSKYKLDWTFFTTFYFYFWTCLKTWVTYTFSNF